MLKELQDKRQNFLKNANELRDLRNELNHKASENAKKRDELNKQTKELLREANELREKRDEFNSKVSEWKDKRNDVNSQASQVYAQVDALRKKENIDGGRSITELRREIESLELRQQTEVLTVDKERRIVERIKELNDEFKRKMEVLEHNCELRELLTNARTLSEDATKYHREVKKFADDAQLYHDRMIELYKKADTTRSDADKYHREFVKAQEAADEYHTNFLKAQKEVRDYDKVIGQLRRKSRDARIEKDQEDVKEKAKTVYEQFQKGEKISTEDLMLLQRSGML